MRATALQKIGLQFIVTLFSPDAGFIAVPVQVSVRLKEKVCVIQRSVQCEIRAPHPPTLCLASGLTEDHESASKKKVALDAAPKDVGEQLPQASTDDWSQSELAQLPGAGPGLVWMLGQCDIKTLSELAQCDASELSTQLGVVGQILDVGEWVRFAQDNAS
jgi:hypothetical protein